MAKKEYSFYPGCSSQKQRQVLTIKHRLKRCVMF